MSKHTPGPWSVGKADQHNNLQVNADGRAYIARVYSESRVEVDELCRANARLIASAPDLLEALEAVTDCWGVGYRSQDDLYKALAPLFSDARSAIAKAKGEA